MIGALCAALAAVQGTVWTVDDDGPADFAVLGAAVGAAADGDMLLVKDGTYGSLLINGKSLAVVAEAGATVTVWGSSVRNLGAVQWVLLRGLTIGPGNEEGLQVKSNAGAVWVEKCQVTGQAGDVGAWPLGDWGHDGFAGAVASDCSSVVFTRCTLSGGDGADLWEEDWDAWPAAGGDGLTADDSAVFLYDCTLSGADAGSIHDTLSYTGTTGGDGTHLETGFLFASGCVFTGGDGGGADEDSWYGCGNGGDAGHGLHLAWGGPAAWLMESQTAGGTGGSKGGWGCSDGADGSSIHVDSGAFTSLAGEALHLTADSPVREGAVMSVGASGPPGWSGFAFVSLGQDPLWAAAPQVALLPSLSGFPVPLGLVPASGQITAGVPIPELGPGIEAVSVYIQTVFIGPASWTLGAPSAVTLLDQTF